MWYLLLVFLIPLIIYYAGFSGHQYWRQRNVPYAKPVPFVGNLGSMMLLKQNVGQLITKIYKEFVNEPYVGIYKVQQPALLIRDPELVKEVLVKQFLSFHDNDNVGTRSDPLFSRSPFLRNGNEWKVARAQISPALTGVKLKTMFPLILEVSKKLLTHIAVECRQFDRETGLDAKAMSALYTTDNFTLCAFGLDGKSFDKPPVGGNLIEIAKSLIMPGPLLAFKDFCLFMKPAWAKLLQLRMFSTEIINYMLSTVEQTLRYRRENNVMRKDFFDSVVKALADSNPDGDVDLVELAGHAATFYLDGVETTAIVMAFAMYELAKNQACQDQLRQDVISALEDGNGNWDHNLVQGIQYLDNVISETIRLHEPIQILTRVCTKEFSLPITEMNQRELTVETGTPVIIPSCSLHSDENYFPEPELFNPDRFADENKGNLTKFSFLPFGEGPRICIGMRYAQLVLKMGLAQVVNEFKITVAKKTHDPLVQDPTSFFMSPLNGIWLNFEEIKVLQQ